MCDEISHPVSCSVSLNPFTCLLVMILLLQGKYCLPCTSAQLNTCQVRCLWNSLPLWTKIRPPLFELRTLLYTSDEWDDKLKNLALRVPLVFHLNHLGTTHTARHSHANVMPMHYPIRLCYAWMALIISPNFPLNAENVFAADVGIW